MSDLVNNTDYLNESIKSQALYTTVLCTCEMINDDDLYLLDTHCRFKSREIRQLRAFLHPTIATTTPSLLIEGPPSSGKSHTLTAFLDVLKNNYLLGYVIVDCKRAFTAREVLRRLLKSLLVHYELIWTNAVKEISPCASVENLPGCIASLMNAHRNVHGADAADVVVVLDGIDKLEEVAEGSELVRCLSELGEFGEDFDRFSFVYVVTRGDIMDVSTLGIPTVRFSGYTTTEFAEILLQYWQEFWDMASDIKVESSGDEDDEDDDFLEGEESSIELQKKKAVDTAEKRPLSDNEKRGFFKQFVELMLQTYSTHAGMCVDVVLPLLRKIWPIFIDPVIREGEIKRNKNDVLATFMKNKSLLAGDVALVTTLENSSMSLLEWKNQHQRQMQQHRKQNQKDSKGKNISAHDGEVNKGNYDLSVKTKYLVIAAFLASYNEPKFDSVFFSKGGRYGNIVSSPKRKRFKASDGDAGRTRRNMSAAMPFKLERLLAILQAIWVESVGEGEDGEDAPELFDDVELMTEIATLSSLKTLVKMKNGDTIGGQTKWKCNVHWNVVKKFSEDVGFEIENHLQQ